MFFQTEFFQKLCVLLNALLDQGEHSAHCSIIGPNDAHFNSQRLSNAKRLFSETLSPKNNSEVSFDKKVIRIQS